MDGKPIGLLARTRAFSIRIIRLYSALASNSAGKVVGSQIIRSGTSVGAHLHEAKRSRSDAEMISKIEVALQELEETLYWLLILEECGRTSPARLHDIKRETNALIAMLVGSARKI